MSCLQRHEDVERLTSTIEASLVLEFITEWDWVLLPLYQITSVFQQKSLSQIMTCFSDKISSFFEFF